MGSGGKMVGRCCKGEDLSGQDLSEKLLIGANFAFAILNNTNCYRSNMKDISLMFSTLWVTRFTEAELISANLSFADGWESCFDRARMIDANLSSFHGRGCRFRKTDLTGASFERAQLWQADFRGAILIDVSFRFANLRDALFDEETVLDGAVFDGVLPEFLPEAVRMKRALRAI